MRPCACRGSMGGVHASCAEEWIARQKKKAGGSDPPKCPVCGSHYAVEETRPSFLRVVCLNLCWPVARFMLFLAILMLFTEPTLFYSLPNFPRALAERIVILSACGLLLLHRALVLAAFLLFEGRQRPTGVMRFFFHFFFTEEISGWTVSDNFVMLALSLPMIS